MEVQSPMKVIMSTVCTFRAVSEADLKSGNRRQEIVGPRSEVVWLARRLTNYSYPQIGRHLGGRDHTTCISAFERVDREIVRRPEYGDELNLLNEKASEAIEKKWGTTSNNKVAVTPLEVAQRLLVPSSDELGLKNAELRVLARAFVQTDAQLAKLRTATLRAKSNLANIN